MTFEDPADLVRVISAERVRVIHAVREKPAPVSELAATLRRDRKAVRRDVSLLESFELVFRDIATDCHDLEPEKSRATLYLVLKRESRPVTNRNHPPSRHENS